MGDDSGRIRKQEADYTAEVDEALPAAVVLAQNQGVHEGIAALLPLEKKARLACDMSSTTRILVAIVTMCFDAKDWTALSEHLILLSKRRGQLKAAMTKMVQKACEYLEEMPDKETTLKLIETIRVVTDGKIHVEIERANVTMKLAMMKEAEGNIVEAADILQDLQVETFGSMNRREKVEFILEQMRLGLLKEDFIRAQIISKKISTNFFKEENTHELKLKYYNQMLQLAQHDQKYLEMSRYHRAIFDTEQVQAVEDQWMPALRDSLVFAVLAPHGNEQADMLERLAKEEKLAKLPLFKQLLKVVQTAEITPWRVFQEQFGNDLQKLAAFTQETEAGRLQWQDMRKRVVEHNVRVIASYYTQIRMARLATLLELSEEDAESNLSSLVTSKTVFAKIDRPAGIVTFKSQQDPDTVLNEWSSGLGSLMRLVDTGTHLITKELMLHKA